MIENSPKIYVIQRQDGKFYNAKEKWFTSRLSLSSYTTARDNFESLTDQYLFSDCEVLQFTEEDWTTDMASLTTSTIIRLDSVRKALDEVRYILPTVSGLNKNLKNFLSKTSDHLKLVNPIFKDFVKLKENDTDDLKAVYDEFMIDLASLYFYDYQNVSYMIKAYKKDKGSINGICNKILKAK